MNIISHLEERIALPGDDETRRSQKVLSVILIFGGGLVSLFFVMSYFSTGIPVAGYIFLGWVTFLFMAGILIFLVPRLWLQAISTIVVAIIPLTLSTNYFLGGIQSGTLTLIWLLQVPLAAALLIGLRFTWLSLILYISAVVVAITLETSAQNVTPELTSGNRLAIAAGNLIALGIMAAAAILYLVQQVNTYRQRANNLLLNILPAPIALRLKESSDTIADAYEEATVLFADLIGSTPLFTQLSPAEAVDWLNEVFTMFDGLVSKYGLEKIRTVGDNYMVASGVPSPRADHAEVMVQFALDMVDGLKQLPSRHGKSLEFRIGIHSGPLVAGIIGQSKFHYDVWGDTVNIASRMESHGEPMRIQISAATYDLIISDFECERRGVIPIKGKGEMETWFVSARKNTG